MRYSNHIIFTDETTPELVHVFESTPERVHVLELTPEHVHVLESTPECVHVLVTLPAIYSTRGIAITLYLLMRRPQNVFMCLSCLISSSV